MKFCVILLIFSLAVSGCWATFPIPYMAFGMHPPPQQPFFYHQPQRPFPQQPYFPIYDPLRYSQLPTYQYDFYNPPPPQRQPFYPQFGNPYEPTLQYLQRQLPVQRFPIHARKPEILLRPVLQDCDQINVNKPEPQKIDKKSGDVGESIYVEVKTKDPNWEQKTTATVPVAPQQTISEQASTKSTNFESGSTSAEIATPQKVSSEELAVKPAPTASVILQEAITQEVGAKSTSSESKSVTTESVIPKEVLLKGETIKSTNSKLQPLSMEFLTSQEDQNIIIDAAEDLESDAISPKEETASESTTVVRNL